MSSSISGRPWGFGEGGRGAAVTRRHLYHGFQSPELAEGPGNPPRTAAGRTPGESRRCRKPVGGHPLLRRPTVCPDTGAPCRDASGRSKKPGQADPGFRSGRISCPPLTDTAETGILPQGPGSPHQYLRSRKPAVGAKGFYRWKNTGSYFCGGRLFPGRKERGI